MDFCNYQTTLGQGSWSNSEPSSGTLFLPGFFAATAFALQNPDQLSAIILETGISKSVGVRCTVRISLPPKKSLGGGRRTISSLRQGGWPGWREREANVYTDFPGQVLVRTRDLVRNDLGTCGARFQRNGSRAGRNYKRAQCIAGPLVYGRVPASRSSPEPCRKRLKVKLVVKIYRF